MGTNVTDRQTLQALCEAATPGPWFTVGPPWLSSDVETYVIAGDQDPHVGEIVCDMPAEHVTARNDANAAFIAAARQAVPELLADLERAERERGKAYNYAKSRLEAHDRMQQQLEHRTLTLGAAVKAREAAEAERDRLREALANLVRQLDVVLPAVNGVIGLQAARGYPYSGPRLGDELEAARATLTPSTAGRPTT